MGTEGAENTTAVVKVDINSMYKISRIANNNGGISYGAVLNGLIECVREDLNVSFLDLSPYSSDRAHSHPIRISKVSYEKVCHIAKLSETSITCILGFMVAHFPEDFLIQEGT